MEEHIIEVNGKKVYFIHSGSGRPIVLFHGIPTSSRLWDKLIPFLECRYSVYAFDLLGFGRSDKPDSSEINIMFQSGFFIDVFKSLGLKDIILAGHDIGGGIAQIMAVRNRGYIKSLILMDSVCYDSWPIELLKVERKVEMLFEHLPPDVIRELFTKYISDGMFDKNRAQEAANKYFEYFNEPDGVSSFLKAVKSLNNSYTMEIAPLLYRIDIPTLILWGKYDPYLRVSYGYRLSEDIKESILDIIDGAGHFLPEDQPKRTAERMLEFLEGISPD